MMNLGSQLIVKRSYTRVHKVHRSTDHQCLGIWKCRCNGVFLRINLRSEHSFLSLFMLFSRTINFYWSTFHTWEIMQWIHTNKDRNGIWIIKKKLQKSISITLFKWSITFSQLTVHWLRRRLMGHVGLFGSLLGRVGLFLESIDLYRHVVIYCRLDN